MTRPLRPRRYLAASACLLIAACGGGGGSAASTTATVPASVPGAPVLASVGAGNASASLVFTAPASNGGSTVTGYVASCTAAALTLTASGSASPLAVPSMSNGTSYSCTVAARNSVGLGPDSNAISVTPTAAVVTPTGTAGVVCGYSDSGTQALSYEQARVGTVSETLAYSVAWTCDSSTRHLAANSVPNHAVSGGVFATRLSAQNTAVNFSMTPAVTGMTTVRTPAYAINGVRFEPGTAGTCPDTATSDLHCSYGPGGGGSWKMEALAGAVSPWKFDFGTDANNAHTQPSGEYHYHAVPTGLLAKRNPAHATSMTLIGFATDGFPVYSRLGYTVAGDKTSALKNMTGSYRVKTTPDANRPSATFFPMGHFAQDWEYVAGSGDLDQCNGRSGVTPEFPNGIYHYFATDSYPFVQRCVKGAVAAGT